MPLNTGIRTGMAKQLPYLTIHEIFSRFRDSEPEPKGELEHVNAYTLVVAVALSAQATDAGVNKATNTITLNAPFPASLGNPDAGDGSWPGSTSENRSSSAIAVKAF